MIYNEKNYTWKVSICDTFTCITHNSRCLSVTEQADIKLLRDHLKVGWGTNMAGYYFAGTDELIQKLHTKYQNIFAKHLLMHGGK